MSDDRERELPGMIGRHPSMLEVYRRVRKLAPTRLPILIVGETGTGKELVARAIHDLSGRGGPFVAVNCAAVPDTLAESELFGAEAGAFTGAQRRREGVLRRASAGTLFLDEVCSMRVEVQAKLLRAIEQSEFTRVGGHELLRSDLRIVAAVSRPVPEVLAMRAVRPDLLHRIGRSGIALPPLRERGRDVLRLAEFFLRRGCTNGHGPKVLNAPAQRAVAQHAWPGNVRELEGVIETLVAVVEGGAIEPYHIEAELAVFSGERNGEQLEDVLRAHAWNITHAARHLRVPRTTLIGRMRAAGLRRPVPVRE